MRDYKPLSCQKPQSRNFDLIFKKYKFRHVSSKRFLEEVRIEQNGDFKL